MKKVFTFVVVLFAAAMVSCGGANQTAVAAEEPIVEEAVVEVADTCCTQVDSAAVAAPATEVVVK